MLFSEKWPLLAFSASIKFVLKNQILIHELVLMISLMGWGNKSGRRQNEDCEVMGVSWLLNKDRVGYIETVSGVSEEFDDEDGSLQQGWNAT